MCRCTCTKASAGDYRDESGSSRASPWKRSATTCAIRQLTPAEKHFAGSARPSVRCSLTRFSSAHAATSSSVNEPVTPQPPRSTPFARCPAACLLVKVICSDGLLARTTGCTHDDVPNSVERRNLRLPLLACRSSHLALLFRCPVPR